MKKCYILIPKQQNNLKTFFYRQLKDLKINLNIIEDENDIFDFYNPWLDYNIRSYKGKSFLKFFFKIFFRFQIINFMLKNILSLFKQIFYMRYFQRSLVRSVASSLFLRKFNFAKNNKIEQIFNFTSFYEALYFSKLIKKFIVKSEYKLNKFSNKKALDLWSAKQ